MSETLTPHHDAVPLEALHAGFLSLLPRLEAHARFYFRYLRCPQSQSDAVAETVAIAWKWYVRATQRGKDVGQFATVFAVYAARAVRCGRRLCRQEKANDALSSLAQKRKGFTVAPLPRDDSRHNDSSLLDQALLDNTQTPVLEQIQFRCDFPAWRLSRAERDRRVMDELMAGERTLDVARRHGISPARISQLRREFYADWERFCEDLAGNSNTKG